MAHFKSINPVPLCLGQLFLKCNHFSCIERSFVTLKEFTFDINKYSVVPSTCCGVIYVILGDLYIKI